MFYLGGNFNFHSKHNEFGFMCYLAIIMEVDIDRSTSLKYPPWSLLRVTTSAFQGPGSSVWPCAYQKPLWFKTKRVCCKQKFFSLSRQNTVCGTKRSQAYHTRLWLQQTPDPSVHRIFVWSLCWITLTAKVCSRLLSTFWDICLCCGLTKWNWSGLWLTVKFWQEKLSFG